MKASRDQDGDIRAVEEKTLLLELEVRTDHDALSAHQRIRQVSRPPTQRHSASSRGPADCLRMTRGQGNPVLAAPLRLIQSTIRTLDKLSGRANPPVAHRNAHADGDPLPAARDGHGLLPEPLGNFAALGGIDGKREDCGKLLAAKTTADI